MSLFEKIKSIFVPAEERAASDWMADIEHLKRSCWVPAVEDGDGARTASKFSGIPYLHPGEGWPICPNCQYPMQLFLQLNSETLPTSCGELWGKGLLQFFYCTSGISTNDKSLVCDSDCEAWAPFSKSTLLRIIAPSDENLIPIENPVRNAFPVKQIVGWTERDDYPNWEEIVENGIELSSEHQDKLAEYYPRDGEKLGGWPHWIQSIEYPNCPECNTRMRHLFQIDSEKNLPFMFGDVGIGHITQCPNHPTQLAFGWACG